MGAHEFDTNEKTGSQQHPEVERPRPEQAPATARDRWLDAGLGAEAYAALLQRTAAGQPARAGQLARQLQRQYGNRYVAQLTAQARQPGLVVQPKLAVTSAADQYEQEADQAAWHLAPMPAPADHQSIESAEPERETIAQPHRSGKALPDSLLQDMEISFGVDFSAIRIHEGSEAESIGASAYTQGNDIHFAPGHYKPWSQAGKEIIAHELTHVVQQRDGRVLLPSGGALPVNDDLALEKEANETSKKVSQGQQVHVSHNQICTSAIVLNTYTPLSRAIQCYPAVITGPFGQQETVEVANAAEQLEAQNIVNTLAARYHLNVFSPGGLPAVLQQYGVPAAPNVYTRTWTITELRAILAAANHYAQILGQQRYASSRSQVPQEVIEVSKLNQTLQHVGGGVGYDPNTFGEAFVQARNFSMFQYGEVLRDPALPNVATEQRITATHEMAHLLIDHPAVLAEWTGNLRYWHVPRPPGSEPPVSAYARTNAAEDLAETVAWYFERPMMLQANFPVRYKLIQTLVAKWKLRPRPGGRSFGNVNLG
jgi:Domain of unknown function (DUF4157)